MIRCFINGSQVYPAMDENIKLVKENPLVSETDERTFDVKFPLGIIENLRVFGPLCRRDTSKVNEGFQKCALMDSNTTIIEGRGVVTAVNENEVKLQIIGGKAKYKYREDFENTFIDDVDYPQLESRYRTTYRLLAPHHNPPFYKTTDYQAIKVTDDHNARPYIGVKGKFMFIETEIPSQTADDDDRFKANANVPVVTENGEYMLYRPAVQPNLFYVLRHVLSHLGFSQIDIDFDTAPWSSLYIASSNQTTEIRHSLPHWTVKTLLDEFCNLFNASVHIDGQSISFRKRTYNENILVVNEADEEFAVEYDEDGISTVDSANVCYEQSGDEYDDMVYSKDVLRGFTIVNLSNMPLSDEAAARTWLLANGREKALKRIFRFADGALRYWKVDPDTDELSLSQPCYTYPLIRDKENDSETTLHLIPAVVSRQEGLYYTNGWFTNVGGETSWELNGDGVPVEVIHGGETCLHPGESHRSAAVGCIIQELHDEYMREDRKPTVEEVVEGGADIDAEETEDTESMALFFGDDYCLVYDRNDDIGAQAHPAIHTDQCSLSLQPHGTISTVGNFHQFRNTEGKAFDNQHEHTFYFLYDGIPDVTKTFLINNKLYLCKDVEVQITQDGADRRKTGHFYEVLS